MDQSSLFHRPVGDHAQGVFGDVLQHLVVPSYGEDGIVFGTFDEGNEGTAVYNSSFRRFQSPCRFLSVTHGVTGDWKFFPDTEHWPGLWARRRENRPSRLLRRNYAGCRGARGAIDPRVASLRKELPHAADGGPRGTLAGVARLGGRDLDLVPKSATRGGDAKRHTIRRRVLLR